MCVPCQKRLKLRLSCGAGKLCHNQDSAIESSHPNDYHGPEPHRDMMHACAPAKCTRVSYRDTAALTLARLHPSALSLPPEQRNRHILCPAQPHASWSDGCNKSRGQSQLYKSDTTPQPSAQLLVRIRSAAGNSAALHQLRQTQQQQQRHRSEDSISSWLWS